MLITALKSIIFLSLFFTVLIAVSSCAICTQTEITVEVKKNVD